jgi:3-oxoacyl-[acyl-carrier protein] reductase
MIDLSGKSAVVTGGSRGIGRAIAVRLARQGADVAFSYSGRPRTNHGQGSADESEPRNAAAEETVSAIEALGRRAIAVQADVTRPESSEALVKAALAEFRKIDILVNNAGITRDDLIMRMSIDAWRDVLETNLFGAFYMTKAVTRPMLKARGGRIVNITSVSGQAGQMGQANYSSAKAGLIGLTKATARELASRGITCNAVAPGFVLTELTSGLADELKAQLTERTPLGRFGTPEEIADAVAFLASDEAAYITGQVLAVDGGLVMM